MLTPSEERRHKTQCRRIHVIDALIEHNLKHIPLLPIVEAAACELQNIELRKERAAIVAKLPTGDATAFFDSTAIYYPQD